MDNSNVNSNFRAERGQVVKALNYGAQGWEFKPH